MRCLSLLGSDRHRGLLPTPRAQRNRPPLQAARWPETRGTDGCGEGEPADGAKPSLTCGKCIFWHRPGIGIDPSLPGDRVRAWWREAGYCRRYAPRPGIEIGTHAFWHATHGRTDHCFDGKAAAGSS